MQINWSVVLERRQEYKLSQKTLAKKAGVSTTFISRLENNKNDKENFNFLSLLRVLNALDLQIEDFVTYISMKSNITTLNNLDKIREQGALNLLETALKQLTLVEWRSKHMNSVYYDWHKALWYVHLGDYSSASINIDKALERIEQMDSMIKIKINIYIAKGYIESLKGDNGRGYYVKSEALYQENKSLIDYRTRIRLVYYIIKGYMLQGEFEKAKKIEQMIMSYLDENQSIYLKKEIKSLIQHIE